jgi:hypothetical protein
MAEYWYLALVARERAHADAWETPNAIVGRSAR